MDVLIVLPC